MKTCVEGASHGTRISKELLDEINMKTRKWRERGMAGDYRNGPETMNVILVLNKRINFEIKILKSLQLKRKTILKQNFCKKNAAGGKLVGGCSAKRKVLNCSVETFR